MTLSAKSSSDLAANILTMKHDIISTKPGRLLLAGPRETPESRAGKLLWIHTAAWDAMAEARFPEKCRINKIVQALIWPAISPKTSLPRIWRINAKYSSHTPLATRNRLAFWWKHSAPAK